MASRSCCIDGCDRPYYARNWCQMHYERWLRLGKTDLPKHPTDDEEFLKKVNKNGPVPAFAPHLGPCWLWTGTHSHSGYGTLKLKRKILYAHHHFTGYPPPGLVSDHLCRVRDCVNPSHLEFVTMAVNTLRGESQSAKNARKTACYKGHPLESRVNATTGQKYRVCPTCRREYQRQRYSQQKLDALLSSSDTTQRREEG